jgi:Papain fold toxin 2
MITEIEIQQIRAIARLYGLGECDRCADAIQQYLVERQLPGQRLLIKTRSPTGIAGHIYDDGTNQLIATNGYHEGISIQFQQENIVIDNLYPEGILRSQWVINLVATSPLTLIESSF